MPHVYSSPNVKDLDLLDAVRRGMAAHVRRILQVRGAPLYCIDPSTGESTTPFEHALEHQRWAVALDLWDARGEFQGLLPAAILPSDSGAGPDCPPPDRDDTQEKRAYSLLLWALRNHRPEAPLPPPLPKRLVGMLQEVVKQEGANTALLRTLNNQPAWWNATPLLLEQGASPDAYALDSHGHALTALTAAGVRGIPSAVRQLLAAGANPLWRHHDNSLAAHRAADLSRFVLRYHGAPDLNTIRRRQECVNLMSQHPETAAWRNPYGHTPAEVLALALEWLRKQPEPAGDGLLADDVLRYRQDKMDLLLQPAHAAPRRRVRM